MVRRSVWLLAFSVLFAVAPAQSQRPPEVQACLTDSIVEGWLATVQDVVQPWRRDPLRGIYERMHPGDPGSVQLVRDAKVCRRAVQALCAETEVEGCRRAQAAYVLRLPDGGHVLILPGDTAGEWQVSHWFDRQWRRAPVALGL